MTLRYRYFLTIKKISGPYCNYKDLVLIDRLEGKIVKSLGFKDMYYYILDNKINFYDIKLKDINYNDLFEWFVDETSINPKIKKGGKI